MIEPTAMIQLSVRSQCLACELSHHRRMTIGNIATSARITAPLAFTTRQSCTDTGVPNIPNVPPAA